MPKIPPQLKTNRDRFESALFNEVPGFGFIDLISLIPLFTNLFSLCKKQPPPNPVSKPSPAEQKAYEMNWHATTNYIGGKERYKNSVVNSAAREVRKKNKRDGTPITKEEAQTIAIAALDEARLTDVPTLAIAISSSGE